jgi:hypothetical protein
MAASPTERVQKTALLQADDLIPDRTIESAGDDAFGHHALARVLADVVRQSTPNETLNVGLFGAWGAGKSSFFKLLREELDSECQAGEIKLVSYDAWRYQDAALERHFIAHVAAELGVPVPDLYSESEKQQIDPTALPWERVKRLLAWVLTWLGPLVGLGILAVVVWAGVLALISDASFVHQLEKVPAFIFAPATLLALIAAGSRIFLTDALVTRRRRPPAEEELGKLFEAELESARTQALDAGRPAPRHFVLFIDELDRCRRTEVVSTLTAIKNFLGKAGCIFIVAADRDVLEEALLTDLSQSNPTNEEAPYYSSASEFLDKIFQTQIAFPPLREQRRTRFARDLVRFKEQGLWHDLRVSDEGRALDDVIYVLIPGHVQSPRRIKVLLNNFAVNVRRAEARGFAWLERAAEIAKLTVFETEFPSLARDLPNEPRLPELLLLETPGDLSPRTQELLEKHALPPSEIEVIGEERESREEDGAAEEDAIAEEDDTAAAVLRETDRLLVVDDVDRQLLAHAQRAQLRRYLESRSRLPQPEARPAVSGKSRRSRRTRRPGTCRPG